MHINKIEHKSSDKFILKVENCEIREGEKVGLLGENGAGKTTLMSILSGFFKPNITFDIKKEKKDYKVLYIPSDFELYDFLTVGEYIDLYIKYSDCDQNKNFLLNQTGLSEKVNEPIDNLSMGMKKKLTLIPIFSEKVDLFIMDEPFNGIDAEYIEKLKKFIRDSDRAFLISSHITDSIENLCDEFWIMKAGKLTNIISSIGDIRSLIFENGNKVQD